MTDPGMRLLLVVLAKNEESQLAKTVRGLQAACAPETVAAIVLLLAANATEGCLRTASQLRGTAFPIPVEIFMQPCADLFASARAAVDSVPRATHVLFLASDYFLESRAVAGLAARAAGNPMVVHKFSRALPGGGFSPGYPAGAVPLYRLFCAFVRLLYGCGVTDPVFPVMIVPVRLLRLFRNKRGSLLAWAEWVFALMRAKTPIEEVPAESLPRTEQENSSTLLTRLRCAAIAVSMRFAPLERIWKEAFFSGGEA